MSECVSLSCHPVTPTDAITDVSVSVHWSDSADLILSYFVTAAGSSLNVPALAKPESTDNLWQHLCFEVFIAAKDSPAYTEFNFSPSRQWAAYAFAHYRRSAQRLIIANPAISWAESLDGYVLQCCLSACDLPLGESLTLGVAAVIEEHDHPLSYWALAHTAERPDFHKLDSFVLELSRP